MEGSYSSLCAAASTPPKAATEFGSFEIWINDHESCWVQEVSESLTYFCEVFTVFISTSLSLPSTTIEKSGCDVVICIIQ